MAGELGTAQLGLSILGTGSSTAALAADPLPPVPDTPAILLSGTLLQLWKFTISGSADELLVVDFFDPDPSATLGEVTYDGEQYTTVSVSRGGIDTSADSLPQFSVTIADPLGSIWSTVSPHDPDLVTAELTIIDYEDLATPSLAKLNRSYKVLEFVGSWGPRRVTASLGTPRLDAIKFPQTTIERETCWNVYEDRFSHHRKPLCNYPSDEFGDQTAQTMVSFNNGIDGERIHKFGWTTINAAQESDLLDCQARVGLDPDSGPDKIMSLYQQKTSMKWLDADQDGLFAYKVVYDNPDGLDVMCKLERNGGVTDHYDSMIGVLLQSHQFSSRFVFFGFAYIGDPTLGNYKHRVRTSLNGTSTTTDYTIDSDNVYRIKRSGTDWYFYTRYEDPAQLTYDESTVASWTQRGGAVTLDMDTFGIRAGCVVCADSTLSKSGDVAVGGEFYYFRFLGGGLSTCDYGLTTPNGCQAHGLVLGNSHQFQGMLATPNETD